MISTFLLCALSAVLVFATARRYYLRPQARVAPDYEREMTYLELDARELVNTGIHYAEVEARILRRISKMPPTFLEAGMRIVQSAQAIEAHGRKMLAPHAAPPVAVVDVAPVSETRPSASEAKGISMASMRWKGN